MTLDCVISVMLVGSCQYPGRKHHSGQLQGTAQVVDLGLSALSHRRTIQDPLLELHLVLFREMRHIGLGCQEHLGQEVQLDRNQGGDC